MLRHALTSRTSTPRYLGNLARSPCTVRTYKTQYGPPRENRHTNKFEGKTHFRNGYRAGYNSRHSPRDSFRSPRDSFDSSRDSFYSPKDSFRPARESFRSPSEFSRSPRDSLRSPGDSPQWPTVSFRSDKESFRSPREYSRSPGEFSRSHRGSFRSPSESSRSPQDSPRSPRDSFFSPRDSSRPPVPYINRPKVASHQTFDRRNWAFKPTATPVIPPDELLHTIRAAFPHVKDPTPIQSQLIPAIHQGEDVILSHETGSGKTFGTVLALLSELGYSNLGTVTLYIVPHRELAYQIESWCRQLLPRDSPPETLVSHVRVLARPNVESVLPTLKQNPPRILIATPGALIDGLGHPQHPLKLHLSLRRIIIDEVDVVMNVPDRYRQVREHRRHRSDAAQCVDRIMQNVWQIKRPKPQMVLMGATLWKHVREWLFAQNGWLAERVVRLNGNQRGEGGERFATRTNDKVVHSAVVVQSDGTLRNMLEDTEAEPGILTQKPRDVLDVIGRDQDAGIHEPQDSSEPVKSPPSVLEAIATSVALDVAERAMAVFPNGVSVVPIVDSFKALGVDARLLNLQNDIGHIERPGSDSSRPTDEGSRNPLLLVTTPLAARGLDVPTLSHVYIVGGLESLGEYLHVAGRVGRFGTPGSVISFVTSAGTTNPIGGASERRLRNFYERMGAKVVPFAHI